MPQTQVYPRWRGEHISSRTRASFRLGLSPLARGTHTPLSNSCDLPTVYPRWRGEHNVRLSPLCVVAGLSPLARGTLHGFGFLFDGRRFIPAGAGNTYIRAKNKATATVYPRWRGEHIYQNISFYSHGGLSPLARGTRIKHGLTRRAARFIPAGAGNTPRLFKRGRRGSVYPRWRGEHRGKKLMLRKTNGLSPLARGTL